MALLLWFHQMTMAAPYVPPSDDTVLEQVPAGAQMRRLKGLRDQVTSRPDDPGAVIELASAYLDLGRNAGDPRFISYAEASLAPWVGRTDAPAEVLVLAAIAQQSSHNFKESLRLLDRALQLDRNHPQAWLTRATVQQVQGDFAAARTSCVRLVQSAGQMIALGCLSAVNSMTGQLPASYRTLQQAFTDDARLTPQLRGWFLSQLGDMAVRLGDDRAAEAHFKAGLAATPDDLYLKGEYADLLLRQKRTAEVLDLLRDNEAQDALLVRLAIAGRPAGPEGRNRWAQLYQERYDDAVRAGATLHQREHARFLLDVRGDAKAALAAAASNWQTQREPADIRLYAAAAKAAGDTKATAEVDAWIRANNYQDQLLTTGSTLQARVPQ